MPQLALLQKQKVVVRLKFPPIQWPNKLEHSRDELRASSLAATALAPIKSLSEICQGYALIGMETDGKASMTGELTRVHIESMKYDPAIASIDVYREEQSLSPELPTLSVSAYNPGSIPSGSGSGIHAATFETGLTSTFLSCIGVTPAAYDTDIYGILQDIRHSNGTFRCLAATAPSASLYHRRSVTFDGTNDMNYIINNSVQTLSMSATRGGTSAYHSTYSEFLAMDDFAYRYPYPVFVNPTANAGYGYETNWQLYNGISVGNVRHTNGTTYELADCTQTKNPPPVYGGCISGTGSTCSGDREMPYVVIPGIPSSGTDFATTCLDGAGSIGCGTSWSAPVGNGLAADILSADSRMIDWPEKVRAILVLTAQNVDGGYWAPGTDGRDGGGVVSGSEAVSFAQNHTFCSVGNTAVEKGIATGALVMAHRASP